MFEKLFTYTRNHPALGQRSGRDGTTKSKVVQEIGDRLQQQAAPNIPF